MAKKNKIKFNFNSPVILTLSIISILFFVFDNFVLKQKLNQTLLLTPTLGGDFVFNFKSVKSYLRILLYIFGGTDPYGYVLYLILFLQLGTKIEEYYGSVVCGIMIFAATIFTGVLSACSCENAFSGIAPVVCMLIILDTVSYISKKNIPITSVLIIVLFFLSEYIKKNPNGLIGILIILAGGLCGSLFAFMATPKKRAAKKTQNNNDIYNDSYNIQNESEKKSKKFGFFRNKDKNIEKKKDNASDETVIGSIEL